MSDRQKAILALAIVLVAWSVSSVVVKYLIGEGYDIHTQNFYRYSAGTLAVLPFLMRRLRARQAKLDGRVLAWLALAAVPNLSHQITWPLSLNWIGAGLATFLNKSSVLFAALLAFLFYAEERWLFRSGRFLSGLALTVLGTVGLAGLRGDQHNPNVSLGVSLVLVAAFSWAAYSVAAKRPTAAVGSTVAFGVVGIYTTLVLLFCAVRWGRLSHWNEVPWHVNAIMIGSGIFCIGVAHTLYYYAMRTLTVSVCATMLLTTPLGTLAISHWLFGEKMTAGQLIAGVILIVGGVLTLLARQAQLPVEVARAAEAADN